LFLEVASSEDILKKQIKVARTPSSSTLQTQPRPVPRPVSVPISLPLSQLAPQPAGNSTSTLGKPQALPEHLHTNIHSMLQNFELSMPYSSTLFLSISLEFTKPVWYVITA